MAGIEPEEVGIEPRDTLIQRWIMAVTGYNDQHVIRSNQVGKRPKDDYATYYQIGGTENQYPYKKKVDEIDGEPIPDDDIEVTYTTPETVTYDINVFSRFGDRLLKDLFKSRNLLAIRLILKLGNLVIRQRSETRDLTQFSDTIFRPRYQADFVLGAIDDMKETNQKILEISLTGKLGDLDTTIEVP